MRWIAGWLTAEAHGRWRGTRSGSPLRRADDAVDREEAGGLQEQRAHRQGRRQRGRDERGEEAGRGELGQRRGGNRQPDDEPGREPGLGRGGTSVALEAV